MVSKQKAIDFIQNRLKIPDVSVRFSKDKHLLLDDVIRAYHVHIPFQNVTHLASPYDSRQCPSAEESIENVMVHNYGGMCFTNNVAMYYILKAVGYDIYPIMAFVGDGNYASSPDHLMLLVRNLDRDGDDFIVDCGFGYPTFCAIDLSKLNQEYSYSFGRFVYSLEDDYYFRKYFSSTRAADGTADNSWVRQQKFQLQPCLVEEALSSINSTAYRNAEGVFNTSLRLIKWTQGENRAISIKDNVLLLEGEDHKFVPHELDHKQAIKDAILQHFPSIPLQIVDSALTNCTWLK